MVRIDPGRFGPKLLFINNDQVLPVRYFRLALLLLTLLTLHTPPVTAQTMSTTAGPERYVQVRTLPERGHVKPGDQIWIGIEQSIYPEWHTYWKNPGDSGAEARIKWSLPDGFIISDIHWPTPHKLSYGPLMNFGYSDRVILLQKLQVPNELPEGPLTLSAEFEILVCKEECIPEFSEHTITLNGPNAQFEDNSEYLNTAATRLPIPVKWETKYKEQGKLFVITITPDKPDMFKGIDVSTAEFFPFDWGLISNPEKAEVWVDDNEAGEIRIAQKRGDRSLNALNDIKGVLAFDTQGTRLGFAFTAKKDMPVPAPAVQEEEKQPESAPAEAPRSDISLIGALFLALLGGIVLNLMPCVFPVLSIKALSLVKISEKQPGLAALHGFAYTAGIVLSFLAIAALLIALKAAGAEIGWGFQLQNPFVVALLAYLLFVIGLNFSGGYEISSRFGNIGQKLTQGEGLSASFFTGILATLVATPCTAPFMAAAIGYALLQPALINLMIFAALGLGLALPYLALSLAPALQKKMPKPGPWMENFRQFLAFPMFASAAWLVWVIAQQAGPMGVLSVLMGMVFLALGLWLLGHMPKGAYWRYKLRILALISFVLAILMLPATHMAAPDEHAPDTGKFGEAYSPEKLKTFLAGSDPVFVEMTAAWCITCKLNHATSINIDKTKTVFADHNVQYLIGDWTNQDPEITKYLNSFGRNGVPVYVYYGAPTDALGHRPEPVVLPQILTPGIVAETITGS